MIDLRPDFLDTLKRLLADNVPDCEVRIFGSRYNWTATDASDLDLALVGPGKLNWKTLARLKAALEESSLPYRVDVLDWRAISPEFQKVINQGYEVIQKPGLGTSSSTFSAKRFCEIAKVLPGFAFKSTDFGNEGYPVVKIAQINPPRIEFENCQRIQEDKVNGLDRFRLHKDDILIAMTGATIGKVGRIKEDCIAYVNQRVAKIDSIEGISDRDFLYYLITDQINNSQIVELGLGSAQANLSGRDLEGLKFKVPDLTIQRRIASVLTALDEKIELNRQANATLEAIAQAIFKEWFVDFNFPGATDKMVESELGMIPHGWRVGKLGEMVEISSGKGLKKGELTETGYPVLGANGLIGYTDKYLVDEELILTGRVGTLGTFQLVNEKVWISDNVLIMRPTKQENYCFAYFGIKKIDFRNLNRGSTQPLVTKTDLLNQQILIPDSVTMLKFDKISRALYSHIFNNEKKSSTLASIRNALLPKLMSGEIEV